MPVDQTVFAGILCKCEIITCFFLFHKTSSRRIITFYGWKCGSENYLMISGQWQRSRREQTIPVIHFDSLCDNMQYLFHICSYFKSDDILFLITGNLVK